VPTLLERFLQYVRIDTQSDESSDTSPSTLKQLDLCRLLADECRSLGLSDVTMEANGIVMATVPSTVEHASPTIVWNAHVDTSPEFSGTNVKPVLHWNYDGQDIVLLGDKSRVLRVAENPELAALKGSTIITTDGTTLLGADDKSGVAVIMSAVERLMANPEIPHGPIRVLFTVDEEIGRGIKGLDFAKLGGVCGYTLDSGGAARIDTETFSADGATVTVTGINTHPSVGKGAMVNAIRILSEFVSQLPVDHLSPETTDGRQGFIHPYVIEGGVAQASLRIILRDFETAKLADYAALLESIAEPLRRKHPRAKIEVATRHAEGAAGHPEGGGGSEGRRHGADSRHHPRRYRRRPDDRDGPALPQSLLWRAQPPFAARMDLS
jgi:tripeptide aminopeptidase